METKARVRHTLRPGRSTPVSWPASLVPFSALRALEIGRAPLRAFGTCASSRPENAIWQACETLNHGWAQEIRGLTDHRRLRAGAERPTFGQLRESGMTIREDKGGTVYQRPEPFDVRSSDGYFANDVLRSLCDENDFADGKLRRGHTPARGPSDRTAPEYSRRPRGGSREHRPRPTLRGRKNMMEFQIPHRACGYSECARERVFQEFGPTFGI